MDLTRYANKKWGAIWLMFASAPLLASINTFLYVNYALMPTAFMALATARFIDTALAVLREGRPASDITAPLWVLMLVLGAFSASPHVGSLVTRRMELRLQREMKPAVVKKHAALAFKHIENAESWELIARVSRDPVKAVMDAYHACMQMVQVFVYIGAVLGLILAHVWWAAIIIAAFSTPMFWLSVRAGRKNYQAGRDAEKFNRRTEYLDEVLTGRENVDERTVFGYGGDVNRRWQDQYEAGRIMRLKVEAKMFLINKGAALCLAFVALLIALTLIGPVLGGQISAGMFMGIMSAVFGMIQILGWQVSWSLENIAKGAEYMKDLSGFIALSEAEGARDLPDPEPPAFSSVEFRNVRFRYPGNKDGYVLDGMSFILEQGRHYAFVGRNGAGKTTITKLFTGLYDGYEGEILINGKELRQYGAGALKALFSVVYQDFAKYYVPMLDNILLGDAGEEDGREAEREARAAESASQAGLDGTIGGLKDGLHSWLGKIKDEGIDISGGEWQRVAIARSLFSRAPVKMLDEPTAALDPISESRVYEEFEKLMRGKTTVFISHRLGSTKLADEILVIDGGIVAERGSHDELMAQDGQYAEMFEAQRGWYV